MRRPCGCVQRCARAAENLKQETGAYQHAVRRRLDVKLFRPGGDGGIDCMAYDPDPIRGGKIAIQAKLYTRTVAPTHVRDLWGTVQHEGALKGIMITTSGFGPDSYKFAAGKPLSLIDGTGLLALGQKHGIPARILNTGPGKSGP
jgi:restriction system protein